MRSPDFYSSDEFFLPQSLIDDILKHSDKIRDEIESVHEHLAEIKDHAREKLAELGLLKTFEDSGLKPANTCGIDGSYVIESLLSIDVVCAAAVGIEGQPPYGKSPVIWDKPHHDISLICLPHSELNSTVARSIMVMKEINLAANAPHDVVLLDGSAFTPVAAVASVMKYLDRLIHTDAFSLVMDEYSTFRKAFRKVILRTEDDDHIYAFMAKYVTSKLLTKKLLNADLDIDDRAFSTIILKENEYIVMPQFKVPGGHIVKTPTGESDPYDEVLSSIRTVYYRPGKELPAMKVEIPEKILSDPIKFSFLLESIASQCFSASILEPYPLFLADQFAKNMKEGVKISRESATLRNRTRSLLTDLEVFMNFYSYRTSTGVE